MFAPDKVLPSLKAVPCVPSIPRPEAGAVPPVPTPVIAISSGLRLASNVADPRLVLSAIDLTSLAKSFPAFNFISKRPSLNVGVEL